MPSVTPCQNCDSSGVTFGPAWLKSPAIQEHTIRSGADMADSDRSRSPVHARNRPDQRSARPPVQLPGFPRWRGPMGAAVRASMNMRGPQMAGTLDANPVRTLWVWTLLHDTIMGRFPISSNTTIHTTFHCPLPTTLNPPDVPVPSNTTMHSILFPISAKINRFVTHAIQSSTTEP